MADILVVGARGIPGAEGGAEKHAEMTFPQFAANDCSVTLLGVKPYIRDKEYKGIRLVGIPTLRVANTDKVVYHILALLYAAFTRPKLVHLQGLNAAFLLVFYKLVGLKVVLRYGSTDHLHAKWGFIGRISFRLCDMQVRFADRVITVSDVYKRQLEERYNLQNVDVVPNGVDTPRVCAEARRCFSSLGLPKNKYVLAVGRLTVDKDYDTLVRAMDKLKDKDVKLVVAGGASEAAYAERLFSLNSDRIRFIGRIDRRLLAALYENCGVFVNSSHHEGLSNAILEAISFRRPVVVSDIAANKEMNLPAFCYFATGDADALARNIDAAFEKRDDFIAREDKFCTWREAFERTRQIYLNVIPKLSTALASALVTVGGL
ncbi:MAG: glycosyltransferase family 4 protein [Alphaproteobacteria bacterium]|nr:glycosyltransferase family 4 protein [Alphaproteobacteria bacterium]